MNLQDKLERVLRDLHILIARGEEIPGRENKVIIDKKQAAVLLNHLNETVFEMMEAYQVTTDAKEQALRENKKAGAKIIREAEIQSEDIYAASVIYTDEALERLLEIFETASQSTKKVMEEMQETIAQEKSQIARNQVELRSGLEELKDTAKYIRIIENKNKERKREKSERELKRKGYYLGSHREAELSEIERELLKERKEEEKRERDKEKDTDDTIVETASAVVDSNDDDDKITYEKPVVHINEDYFIKAGIPFEKEDEKKPEESKETEGTPVEMDPDMERKLMEQLDNEYFAELETDGKSEMGIKDKLLNIINIIRKEE